ncbi:MAG: tRNA (guanosine(46)-N7)-methyltransferase TrmB [Phycisphaerae bacterium]|nr:tRNA (guanosine(46)-N7)-methyltransferase TrmB [Phycisphaerae bacterium]
MRPESAKQLGSRRGEKWDTTGVLLDETIVAGPVDLREIFGNDHPVELEIGSGKGTFILARAAARPEVNFLGLEYARAYAAYCADRIRRAGLGNARMLRAEAAHFCKVCLPDECLLRVHVYFPDPWPKRRHNRRRLIQPNFLADVCRTLAPGGQLIVVTDHFGYFRHIRRVLNNAAGFVRIAMPRMTDSEGELVGTNFERKYITQGRPFYATALMRYT